MIDTYNVSVDIVLWGFCKSKLQGGAQSAYEIRCTNIGIHFQGLHPIQQLCRIPSDKPADMPAHVSFLVFTEF